MEWCIHSSGIIFDLPIIYQHIQFLILPHPLTCSTYSSWTWGGLHQCPSTRHFVASRRIFFFSSLFTYPPTNDLIYHLHLWNLTLTHQLQIIFHGYNHHQLFVKLILCYCKPTHYVWPTYGVLLWLQLWCLCCWCIQPFLSLCLPLCMNTENKSPKLSLLI